MEKQAQGRGGVQRWKRPLQIAVAALLLAWVLSKVPLSDIGTALRETNLLLFVLGTILFFPTFWLQAIRWKLLFPREGEEPLPTSLFFRLICIGQFTSLFLPSTVGGDAVRAYMLGKRRGGVGAATSSVLLGRVIGVVALLVFVWIGALIAPEHLAPFPAIRGVMIALSAATVVALVAFFLVPIKFWERWSHIRGIAGLTRNLAAVRRLPSSRAVAAVLLSIVIQLSSNLLTFVLYRAAGMPFPWEGIFSLIPLLMLLNIIPISFFNIGVREGAMLLLFTTLPGVTPTLCLAAAALGYASVLFPALVGFYFYIRGEKS